MVDMAAQVTKGRLTNASTGDYREFSLNPNDLGWDWGADHTDFAIPGGYPVILPGATKAKVFSFTLRLDGDVGYRLKRRLGDSQDITKSVDDEISWYEQFLVSEDEDASTRGYTKVLFSFGPSIRALPCWMTQCAPKVLQHLPDLSILRADVRISLKWAPDKQPSRSKIYVGGGNF